MADVQSVYIQTENIVDLLGARYFNQNLFLLANAIYKKSYLHRIFYQCQLQTTPELARHMNLINKDGIIKIQREIFTPDFSFAR